MKLNIFKTIALIIGGLAFTSPAAKAATYANGNLLLGFRSSDTATFTSNLLVNLGAASTYRDAIANSAGLVNLGGFGLTGLGSLDTDLKAVFGNDWATNSTTLSSLKWGLVAGYSASSGSDIAQTLYASKPEDIYGTAGTGYNRASATSQGTPRSLITGMGTLLTGASSNNVNAVIVPNSTATSWSAYNPATPNTYSSGLFNTGQSFSYFSNLQGNFSNGLSGSALDLFRILPGTSGTGTYEGSFTLDSSGVVSYLSAPPAAVPEPSRALLLAAGLGSLMLRRRRKSVSL